jgi:hypothetical protein
MITHKAVIDETPILVNSAGEIAPARPRFSLQPGARNASARLESARTLPKTNARRNARNRLLLLTFVVPRPDSAT